MIAFIHGIVKDLDEESILLDTGGLGYQVYTPIAQFDSLPAVGEELQLYTALIVREDLWQLFGFTDKEQLMMFRLLNGVSGVGAKTALAILNTLSPALVVQSIITEHSASFQQVPGIGKKLAQRIVLELKDKCAKLNLAQTLPAGNLERPVDSLVRQVTDEVASALAQLGFTNLEARNLAAAAEKEAGPEAGLEQLVMTALRLADKR